VADDGLAAGFLRRGAAGRFVLACVPAPAAFVTVAFLLPAALVGAAVAGAITWVDGVVLDGSGPGGPELAILKLNGAQL
jgi:hypothetical protein